jgi:branched-chain amino acid transport system ATP-binding protein
VVEQGEVLEGAADAELRAQVRRCPGDVLPLEQDLPLARPVASVLDNVMVGRHHLLRNNFLTGSLYWLPGVRSEDGRCRASGAGSALPG